MATEKNIDNNKASNEREEKREMPGSPEVPDSMSVNDSNLEEITQDGGHVRDNMRTSDGESDNDVDDTDPTSDIVMGTEADVTAEDLELLGDPHQDIDMGDDELVRTEGLDDTDFDGDPLNEAATSEYSTGDDLDMPVSDGSDPQADSMGQGDEENDYYSLDDNNDDGTEND